MRMPPRDATVKAADATRTSASVKERAFNRPDEEWSEDFSEVELSPERGHGIVECGSASEILGTTCDYNLWELLRSIMDERVKRILELVNGV